MTCPTCGRENRADARFCDACGTTLHADGGAAGERRQLTALFCDLVDYTGLSRILDDEEDLHEVVSAYPAHGVRGRRALGWPDQGSYVGDDINAYFGYPQAHEDDAERAVRAGLEIQLALGSVTLTESARSQTHAVRTLGEDRRAHGTRSSWATWELESTAKAGRGPALSVAARLQSIALPGSVVMSDATHRLVSGMFVSEDLGGPRLKGIEEPIRAYAVVRSSGLRDRLDADPAAITVPMVGRERELKDLGGLGSGRGAARDRSC